MKKISKILTLALLGFSSIASAQNKDAALPTRPDLSNPSSASVVSANGFICGKERNLVTCKGPLPDGKGSVTGSGYNVVYLTINTTNKGQPVRYTYYSDTGCLVGYTFNASGNPVGAAASHRVGARETFDLSDGKFEKVLAFCTATVTPVDPKENAAKPAASAPSTAPAPSAAPKAQ